MGIETCLSTKLSGWKKIGNFSSWENYFNRISLLRKEELKCEDDIWSSDSIKKFALASF